MRDTSDDVPFIKMPVAAFYDRRKAKSGRRITAQHLNVLAVLSQHRDYRTDVSDFSQEQVGRALCMVRQAVQRCCADLVELGYLASRGRHPKHGQHFYWINFGNEPAPQEVRPPRTSGGAPAPQEVHSPRTSGGALPAPQEVLSPAPQEVHSSGSLSEITGETRAARANAVGRQVGPLSDYWSLPLLESDLDPGTLLVQTARSFGYARASNGKDALQDAYRLFLLQRAKRAYVGEPDRLEFREYLDRNRKNRSELIGVAEKKSAPVEPAKPATPIPPRPRWLLGWHPTARPEWREPMFRALDALELRHGRGSIESALGQGRAMLYGQRGKLLIVKSKADDARNDGARLGADLAAALDLDLEIEFGHFDRTKQWRVASAVSARSGSSASPQKEAAE